MIGDGAKKVISMILPKKSTSIESGWLSHPTDGIAIFRNFENLINIKGENITNAGINTFDGMINLRAVHFPNVITIEHRAFFGNIGLTGVSFPNVEFIGTGAFSGCIALSDIYFPMATHISEEAFAGCIGLKEVSFPNVSFISGHAFRDCAGLEVAYFPALTRISGGFFGCINLREITISAAADISSVFNSFHGCINLKTFNLTGEGHLSVIENGRALVIDKTILLAYPSADGDIIMENIIEIRSGAFAGCVDLNSVTFPLVTQVGRSAFEGCINLTEVYFPVVRQINSRAFLDCISIVDVSFPQVTRIMDNAFLGCINLRYLNIPSIRQIEAYILGGTGDKTLTITMGLIAPSLTIRTFRRTPFQDDLLITKDVIVKIPAGAQGYTPFAGTTVTVSGEDNQDNWANRLRGFGVSHDLVSTDGSRTEVYSDPNQNITVKIIQISD
jgi:hypothetical protein